MTWLLSALGLAKRIPWQVWAALAILGAWAWDRAAQYREGHSEGYQKAQAEYRAAEARAADKQQESASEATVERVIETRTITIKQKARDNAIQSTNDDTPSAASNALNCERLRSAGADIQHIPACGGREDGAEAAPQP